MQYIETFISHLNINTVDITINVCYNHLYYITKDILEEYSMSEIKTIVVEGKTRANAINANTFGVFHR